MIQPRSHFSERTCTNAETHPMVCVLLIVLLAVACFAAYSLLVKVIG